VHTSEHEYIGGSTFLMGSQENSQPEWSEPGSKLESSHTITACTAISSAKVLSILYDLLSGQAM
jgi:hypothetical protein